MKISARLREQAAFVLDICASNDDMCTVTAVDALGYRYGVVDICKSVLPVCVPWTSEVYAEAAQRLREGWEP